MSYFWVVTHTEMVVQLVVLQLILLLCPLSTLALMPYLAKSGCNEKCGNVTIPYPFGMGANCYLDEWFEIDCKKSANSSSRPFLKRLSLEVLQIVLPIDENPGLLQVNNPVFSSYCNGINTSSPGTAVDLRGSSFAFSQTRNIFIAAGCNSRALMENIEPVLSGCTSPCGGCCQATIPSNLKVLNVSFEKTKECTYAFLVDDRLLSVRNSSCDLAVPDLEYVPAALDWGISYQAAEAISRREQSLASSRECRDSSSLQATIQCYCSSGYEGSAYLPDSCQDINECEDQNHCIDAGCVNEVGSYRCVGGGYRQFTPGIGPIIICGLGLAILIFGIRWLYRAIKKRNKIKRKKMFFKRNGGLLLEQQVSSSQGNVESTKVFTSKELVIATDHFNKDRILGQGGQGTVYKGMLSDGRIVAVKKSEIEKEGTLIEQFINEVVILSQMNHRNIVKLLGCCLETDVPLLVYEFVPNGTLSQYLHGQVEELPVSWEMRLQIATEIAGALSYLHSTASIPIYHRDIKSSNILLDEKYRAKVADFGTSRSIAIDQTHLTTNVYGTFGYLDPEYFQSSQYTDKSDVYSFGVVLVELLTGQKAISSLRTEEGRSLATYFIITMEENHLFDILDTQVAKQGGECEIMAFADLAKRCLNLSGRNRPTMTQVRMELERISMLCKARNGIGEANCEEAEYAGSQEVEPWDDVSISFSTSSAVDIRVSSSADSQPLLPDPSR